jgi:ABC-type lipoprotein release transport system permease subunit
MTSRTLIRRSLRFHWRGHLGVLLGAAVGSAALIGALVVGDSVRGSLRETALQRLGWVDAAMAPADRFFTQQLAEKLNPRDPSVTTGQPSAHVVALLKLPGTAARQDGSARANQVNVLGVPEDFWNESARPDRTLGAPASVPASPNGEGLAGTDAGAPSFGRIPKGRVVLNEALAVQLNARPGDDVVLRVHKPTALSRDVPITPQGDASLALRLKVHAITPAAQMGNFSLQANQAPPLNAFLNRDELADAAGLTGKANVIVGGILGLERLSGRELVRVLWPGTRPSDAPQGLRRTVELTLFDWFGKAPRSVSRLAEDGPRSEMLMGTLRYWLFYSNTLADLQLDLHMLTDNQQAELVSQRIFLDPPLARAAIDPETNQWYRAAGDIPADPQDGWVAEMGFRRSFSTNARPLLTYLVNQFRAGMNTTPYSMVTAAGPPWTPADLRDDEIIINQWLADDLRLKQGDALDLTYYLAESGAHLVERTNRFRVRAIVPLSGIYDDRTLMPEFPGLAKAESTHDWDAGFPLVQKLRDQDEKYWKEHRGTPKAFVTLAAGQAMWGNRFGNLTAIRFPVPTGQDAESFRAAVERSLLMNIDPASLGLRFEPVRAQALAAAEQAQDFGGLFLGFSFFLIAAALILMALLFQFGLEQRTSETGTLLALGFTPRQVRRLLLREGMAVAFLGGALGALGGLGYAKGMLHLLTTLWRDAVGGSALQFHVTAATLAIGLLASVVVCAVTIWIVLRRQARRPARELLAEGGGVELGVRERGSGGVSPGDAVSIPTSPLPRSLTPPRSRAIWVAICASTVALALVGWAVAGRDGASAPMFFGAGALLLVAGLAAVSVLLTALDRSEAGQKLSLLALGLRSCTRRRLRSLASVALLACGSFLIVAVGANRLDAGRDATKRASGTGGFALFGESTLPIVRDLNTKAGREFYGLDEETMRGVNVVPFRVRDGDEASCLNLNRAQKPRLLGVKPELLAARGAFTFAKVGKGLPAGKPWELLRSADLPLGANPNPQPRRAGARRSEDAIPAIGDAASIQWALGKKLGDTLDYTDERGRMFQVRLVGAVANSILQGNLIIDEAEFLRRFPGEAGHRMFLIDIPSNDPAAVERVSAALSRALQDVGLELTPATRRLAEFNAVQNTYLNTFQVLGGLGLLLGSMGLGVVVLRNVLERRGELGLLQAVGFTRRSIRWLVLSEHGGLLALGLAVGIVSALLAIAPVLLAPGARLHATALGLTLAGVLASGLVWTWLAIRLALRGKLLDALRNE